MNFYFLPRVDGLKSSVTLVNFTSMDDHERHGKLTNQLIYVTWSDGQNWQHRQLGELNIGDSKVFELSDLPDEIPNDVTPFLYCYPESVKAVTGSQIEGQHMKTLPNWRGNIKLSSSLATASYQGEYPGEMTLVPKGSFVSVNPMMQSEPGVLNKILFVNMSSKADMNDHDFKILRMSDRKVLSCQIVRNNNCTVVDLDAVSANDDDLLISVCPTLLGIPVYLSYDEGLATISLEHTHPPVSSVLFGDTLSFQRHMKSYWLSLVTQ
ncbi:hypothetical protein [Thalassospira lucentensis]|uniref:hypothetical protein n=1 Tax=Thalassospira lucentensis TaxID=168935 RepID=UPI003D2C699A